MTIGGTDPRLTYHTVTMKSRFFWNFLILETPRFRLSEKQAITGITGNCRTSLLVLVHEKERVRGTVWMRLLPVGNQNPATTNLEGQAEEGVEE